MTEREQRLTTVLLSMLKRARDMQIVGYKKPSSHELEWGDVEREILAVITESESEPCNA